MNLSIYLTCSHHVSEGHHTQQRLTAGLDGSLGEGGQQLLQDPQHVQCGGVLLAACTKINTHQNMKWFVLLSPSLKGITREKELQICMANV